MRNAKVLDIALQDQLYGKLTKLQPRPSVYDPDFIAANQVMQKVIEISFILLIFVAIFNSLNVQTISYLGQNSNNMNKFGKIFEISKLNRGLIRLFCSGPQTLSGFLLCEKD